MGHSRVAQPETKKLEISDGDWLLVKRRLSNGERREARQRMYRQIGDEAQVDPTLITISMTAAYLVDWSLIDPQGSQIPILGKSFGDIMTILDSLEDGEFDEISDAVDAHAIAMRAERDAQKKILSGAAADSKHFSSLVGVAGDQSG